MHTRIAASMLCLSLLYVFSLAPTALADPVAIDAVHSSMLFRVKHMNTSYIWGRFNDFSGALNLDGPSPSVNVLIKTDSIDTGNGKREQHLKSPDFFNARQFSTITFKSTKVQPAGDGKYKVDGKLTLHGVEKPITLELVRTGTNKGPQGTPIVGYEATFKIKRSEFGMTFSLEGASDEVLLVANLECGGK
jgi:polyisoprenoid-binding protein YceI